MSPIPRDEVDQASMILPSAADRWRQLATDRADRCMRVRGAEMLRGLYKAQADADPAAEKRAYAHLAVHLEAVERLDDARFRTAIAALSSDDRYVVAGRALDESGRPLREAEITIRGTDDPSVVLGTVTTDETGRYVLDGDRSNLERLIASGGGITETIAHSSLARPATSVVPAERLGDRVTIMDAVRQPIAPVPDRPDRPSGPVRPTPTPIPTPPVRDILLTDVDGIGPRRRARLEEAGITNVQGFARADAGTIAEVLGVSPESATELIKAAKLLLRSNPPR